MSPDIRATYRVQLHKDFGFDDAAAIVPYLAKLGISHLYCSPYLQARVGSTHGYDVVDQRTLNEEIGGSGAHARMCAALTENGMGHILDVVPNHMTVTDRANRWWWDVLRAGPASPYASYFDIDWDPPEHKLRRTILVPILGDHYGRVLDAGEITLEQEKDDFVIAYYEHVLPVAPGTLGDLDLAKVNDDREVMHELLERQHYRLAFWRVAGEELNYRRFFSINDLAALRMDNPDVFDRVHELVLEMVRDGRLEGLRIDHIDGLRDPEGYLTQLRSWAPDAYIVVEKILEPEEELPSTWPVEGTTGYDFLNRATGLLVDDSAEQDLTRFYREFTGETADLATLKHDKKLMLMETELSADVERLTELFAQVCEGHPDFRDYTRNEMRDTLRETIAWFPVYRTYLSAVSSEVSERDVSYVSQATRAASSHRADLDSRLFGFLHDILLLEVDGEAATSLAMRFQQTTGPVMAKGVEDTVFYVYNRFVALNEVGGDPGTFGLPVAEFHEHMQRVQTEWPAAMLASSTHDTKRSEDVRARLTLLSEIPQEWAAAVARWREGNERHRSGDLPDRNIEYLLYQTLVGAWPLSTERALNYILKAAKEAKAHTSWTNPNETYEVALSDFVRASLSDRSFTDDLEKFARKLLRPGTSNSLALTLIKLTAPGVPDIYQGSEVWDLSLVDPDNRRPVDYRTLEVLAEHLEGADPDTALTAEEAGGPKMFVTRQALKLRARRPELFDARSTYEPLRAQGSKSDHVVAFIRGGRALTIATRLPVKLGADWGDTSVVLPEGSWRDELSGAGHSGIAAMAELLDPLPVALLVRD